MSLTRTYSISGETVKCTITYKNIKNAYIRLKEDGLYVTANSKVKIEDLDNFIISKYPLLKARTIKKKVVDTYQLWGIGYTEELFFSKVKLRATEKNYYQGLKNELTIKTQEIYQKIKPNLDKFNLPKVPFIYRKLVSKYGSCHVIKKEITFSLFLAKIEPIYLEYVMYHEYAHLLVPNHSKKFYALLDKLMPNHRKIEKELKNIPIIF